MATLTFGDKMKLEAAFEMGGGYVLGFSDRTFQGFIHDSVGIDIFCGNYADNGTSKAKHLRCFWEKEPNHIVGKLLTDLLDHAAELAPTAYAWQPKDKGQERLRQIEAARPIAERLRRDLPVESIGAIQPLTDEPDFAMLARSVRDAIDKNEPEAALDRLHTFCVRYVRTLCKKHGLSFTPAEPLNSVFGKYVKELERTHLVEATVSIRILKSCISILSDFNDVRNNQSFAHDNPILHRHEALFVFSNIASIIRFLEHIEDPMLSQPEGILTTDDTSLEDDIPF